MVPLNGYWNMDSSKNSYTVIKRTKSKNLLSAVIGSYAEEEQVDLKFFVKILDDRVDSVVTLLGGDSKVDIDWS